MTDLLAPEEIDALRARAERAEAGIVKANSQAEEFERRYYLEKNALEAAQSTIAEQSKRLSDFELALDSWMVVNWVGVYEKERGIHETVALCLEKALDVERDELKSTIAELNGQVERLREAYQAACGYINKCPCDPDIHPAQWEAWQRHVKASAALRGENELHIAIASNECDARMPAQSAIVELEATLRHIAAITHCGGWRNIGPFTALDYVRRLSLPWLNKSAKQSGNEVDDAISAALGGEK